MTKQTRAYIALIFICLAWGTTYLAIRIGVMHYPAFLFAGVRQVTAGLILMGIAYAVSKKTDLSRKNLLRQMLGGFLLITIGNGLVTFGEKYVSSGIAAIICSMMPIFAVIFSLLFSRKEHFNIIIGLGLLLGFCGVGLIFKDNLSDLTNTAYLSGIICLLTATIGWTLGSLVNKKNAAQINPMFNSGLQLFFGGTFLLMGSPIVDDYRGLQLWNTAGFEALCYLIVFGSVLAYAAYNYALNELPVGIATIYAYVNPLVAVILGHFVLGEPLNAYTALAFVTIVLGVYLVKRGYARQHKQQELNDPVIATEID